MARIADSLSDELLQVFFEHPLDRSLVSQDSLNLTNRTRTSTFPWRGQFSPGLVEVLLKVAGSQAESVFDPFVGSGTTLFEASRLGFDSAGVDINPAAISMASSCWFIGISPSKRNAIFEDAASVVGREPAGELFGESSSIQPVDALTRAASNDKLHRGVRLALELSLVLLMGGKRKLNPFTAADALCQVRNLVMTLPHREPAPSVALADARHVPYRKGTFDFVITSPPYINVFNYHQHNRPAMELLGHDVLNNARAEIGANRKHRQNRFLTVIQYCLDMGQVFVELGRVLRPQSPAVFVVGRESRVRGCRFENGAIVAAVASAAGFRLELRQERVFTNRFGERIFEDILHLREASTQVSEQSLIETLRAVGTASLAAARTQAVDHAVRDDLEAAIEKSQSVHPSPEVVDG